MTVFNKKFYVSVMKTRLIHTFTIFYLKKWNNFTFNKAKQLFDIKIIFPPLNKATRNWQQIRRFDRIKDVTVLSHHKIWSGINRL